jgi:hypothetical protein
MGAPYWIMLGCLAAAVLLTVLRERLVPGHPQPAGSVLVWAVLLCLYGACVGLIAGLLTHFFHLSDWVALAIAVPVALPVRVLLAWMSG